MNIIDRLRGVQTKTVYCVNKATTTLNVLTTDVSQTGQDWSSYSSGIFQITVVANASGDPNVMLDGSVDNSSFTAYATLHSDLTTTANKKWTQVNVLAPYNRVRIGKSTTTTHMRISVTAYLKP